MPLVALNPRILKLRKMVLDAVCHREISKRWFPLLSPIYLLQYNFIRAHPVGVLKSLKLCLNCLVFLLDIIRMYSSWILSRRAGSDPKGMEM